MVSDNAERAAYVPQMGVVLILVLMEYGLGPSKFAAIAHEDRCLNPCFNGIWYRTMSARTSKDTSCSLNPCFNGIWSRTQGMKYWKTLRSMS